MLLKDLIKLVSDAYEVEGLVVEYFNDPKGEFGDGLAAFIAEEIVETYDPTASTRNQLIEAHRVMTRAKMELEGIVDTLDIHISNEPLK